MLFCSIGHSQTPAFYILGEKTFKNAEIYSIIESDKKELFITTNKGVFVSQKGVFTRLHTKDKKNFNEECFGLVKDKKRNTFCYNLRGDIFKIERNEINKIATIPHEFVSDRIQLLVDNYNNLIFYSSGNCFHVHTNGEIEKLNDSEWGVEMSQMQDGSIIISSHSNNELFFLERKKLIKHTYNNFIPHKNQVFRNFFSINDTIISYCSGYFQPLFGDKVSKFSKNYLNVFVPISKKEVWAMNKKQGIDVLELKNKKVEIKHQLFPNHFISSAYIGENGCIYLGTFNRGLIVIPNRHLCYSDYVAPKGKINDIAISKNNQIATSQKSVGIVLYDGKYPKIIQRNGKNPIDRVFWLDSPDNSGQEVYYNKINPSKNLFEIPPIKTATNFGKNKIICSTSRGIFLKSNNPIKSKVWKKYNSNFYQLDVIPTTRFYCASFDQKNEIIYCSNIEGTFAIQKNKIKELTFEGNTIISNDLKSHNEYLYCATQNHGILVFKDGTITRKYLQESFQTVQQISIKDHILFALCNDKVNLINLKTNEKTILGIEDGVSTHINKFQLSNDRLWLFDENQKLLSIEFSNLLKYDYQLSIAIDSLNVDKIQLVPNKEKYTFSYDKNSFSFHVSSKVHAFGNQEKIAFRIKELDSTWNETKQESTIDYPYLPYGNYTFEVFSFYDDKKSAIETFEFTIQKPIWLRWWFIVSCLLILGTIIYWIFRRRINILRKKQAERIEKEQLKSNFIEAELRTLRSQMNPHFIFNSLHSIQALILNSEIESSYDYLVLFSKLVRKTLNYSNEEFISLSEEIEFLEIYLQLEQLRFGDNFEFKFNVEEKKEIQIPSLILQPFLENAIIHGLQHKTGNKKLTVDIEESQENTIKCTITDNGIGRAEAKKIKERQRKNHKSFALEAIEKRLKIYQAEYGNEFGLTIIDLSSGNHSTGTMVQITMPVKYKY